MISSSTLYPVKLFVVTLHRDTDVFKEAMRELQSRWGDTDYVSKDFPFDITDYYEPEMGAGLLRRFISFSRLIQPDRIVEAKLHCVQVESTHRSDNRRQINLDPGYLDYYKVVLASRKFGGQKVYLREGVYADMTLILNRGKWESFAWGFPDFKSGKYDEVLFSIRNLYKKEMKSEASQSTRP